MRVRAGEHAAAGWAAGRPPCVARAARGRRAAAGAAAGAAGTAGQRVPLTSYHRCRFSRTGLENSCAEGTSTGQGRSVCMPVGWSAGCAEATAAGRPAQTGQGRAAREPEQARRAAGSLTLPKQVRVNHRKAECVTTAMLVSGRCTRDGSKRARRRQERRVTAGAGWVTQAQRAMAGHQGWMAGSRVQARLHEPVEELKSPHNHAALALDQPLPPGKVHRRLDEAASGGAAGAA